MTERKELSQALEARNDDMVETLQRWIRIPSTKGEPAPGAPFGPACRQVLEEALQDGARLELNPRDVEGYACDFEIGEGTETIAILAHLDIVPAGEGWQVDPFGAVIQDGKMYGRGTGDNKGPAVASLFAMRAVLDASIPLKKKVRLILGCDEESGWADMDYYQKKIGIPDVGFSPDAEYPVINTEKGIGHLNLYAEPAADEGAAFPLYAVQSGERANVIPGTAKAEIGGDIAAIRSAAEAFSKAENAPVEVLALDNGHAMLTVTGVPGHAAMPDLGRNAASLLLQLLAKLGVGGTVSGPIIKALAETAGHDYDGEGFGVKGSDDASGPLTMNLGILSFGGGQWSLTLDFRYPVFFNWDRVVDTVSKRLTPFGFVVERGHCQAPHHVPESSEVVTKLLDVYRGFTGDMSPARPIGGGTYARCLREGVAFGAGFPEDEDLAHQAGEYVSLEHLLLNAKIIAHSIVALCG